MTVVKEANEAGKVSIPYQMARINFGCEGVHLSYHGSQLYFN